MYSIVVDGKEIILSRKIQTILNNTPKIWSDLKDLYESKNYREGKITNEELEIIFNLFDYGIQIDKRADFEEFGVPYILDILKSENYGKGLISNELIVILIGKMCFFIENDSFDDRIVGRIDYGCLNNIKLIITGKNYVDMMLTDEEIDLVLNEDDNDIEWISPGVETAKMVLNKISSISDETKKEINELLDGIGEDDYFFESFFSLLESKAFRKGKIKKEYLPLIISGLLGDMNYRFNQLLEILNSELVISDKYLGLICKSILEESDEFDILLSIFKDEICRKSLVFDKSLDLVRKLDIYEFKDIQVIFNSENYAKGLIPEEYLNLILTTEGVKLCYVFMELLTSECYAYGFITKEHLEMLANEKYLAIGYMVERVLCKNLGEQEKYSYVLGLLNFDNKEMLCGLCDIFVENKCAKDIKKAAYGYIDYSLMFPRLPKGNNYHIKKKVLNNG